MQQLKLVQGDNLKLCKKCGEWKSRETDFYRYKHSSDGLSWRCIPCLAVYNKEHRPQNREKQLATQMARKNHLPTKLWRIAGMIKARAKRRGLECDIGRDDLLELWEAQDGRCYYSGLPMTNINGQGYVYTNVSVDRWDSERGYTKDNVVLCCRVVNSMKTDMSDVEFREWIAAIASHYLEDD